MTTRDASGRAGFVTKRIAFGVAATLWLAVAAPAEAAAQHSAAPAEIETETIEMTQVAPPTMNPWNLGLRFVLELGALGAMAYWGHAQRDDPWRWALAVGIPVAAAATWATFATPHDPSRGGEGLVHVPGIVRLGLELAFFGFAAWGLADLGQPAIAAGYGGTVVVHYAISYERVIWLLGL